MTMHMNDLLQGCDIQTDRKTERKRESVCERERESVCMCMGESDRHTHTAREERVCMSGEEP